MRVWFNRPFALAYRVLRLVREADPEQRFTLLCSHSQAHFAAFAAAHEFAQEPSGLSSDDYVQWCLDFAAAQRVDVLIPGYEGVALVAASAAFAARGVRILAPAPAAILPKLHDKSWVYARMQGLMPLARALDIHGPEEVAPAVQQLWDEGLEACIKPTVSIYGKGFQRLLSPEAIALKRPPRALTVAEWRQRYAADGNCAPQQVLEYLPQHEYSVDCLADHGRWVAGVVRKKALTSSTQILDDHPDLLRHAATLIETLQLNGLINVQFKNDANGQPKLLEVNPRASGGIGMSCLSGINLPYWALRGIADGFTGLKIPSAQTGARVTEVKWPVILAAGATHA